MSFFGMGSTSGGPDAASWSDCLVARSFSVLLVWLGERVF